MQTVTYKLSQHSPAPWRLQIMKSNGDQYISRGKNGPVIAEVTTNAQVPAFSKEEAAANAELISLSPDLKEAFIDLMTEQDLPSRFYERHRELFRKLIK